MLTPAFGIGVSGLKTAQKVTDMIGHNIANANTPGYKRHENNNYEINFSSQQNKHYNPSGVGTTISVNDYPWLDQRLHNAVGDKARNDTVKQGVDLLGQVINDDTLEQAFSKFMAASHDLQFLPKDPVLQEQFNQAGQNFVNQLNRVARAFKNIENEIVETQDYQSIELEKIQDELSRLAATPGSSNTASEINYLKQRVIQLTNSIAGYTRVLSEVIPPILGHYERAKSNVVAGTNGSYDYELITKDDQGYQWNNIPGGDVVRLTEFGNQKFNKDMGQLKTIVGSMQQAADTGAAFGDSNLDLARAAYDEAYGVDLETQITKMMQYQRMYESNAQVIKTADRMIGTLLDIFQ